MIRKLNGPYVGHHENGKLASKGNYRQGRKHGLWVLWNKSGRRKAEATYDNGRRCGPITTFHPNGALALRGHFSNDAEEGHFTLYYENGRPAAEGEYQGGLRHGVWTYRDKSGHRSHQRQYHQGVLILDQTRAPQAA